MTNYNDLLRAGDVTKAKSLATTALEKNQKDVDALVALARIEMFEGDVPKVRKLVEQATKIEANRADLVNVKATLAAETGDPKGALALYDEAIALDDSRSEAFFGKGWLLHRMDENLAARPLLEKAIELDSKQFSYYFYLGGVKFILEDVKGGTAAIEKCLALNPAFAPAYITLVKALQGLNKQAEAEKLLREAMKILPTERSLKMQLSYVLTAQGNIDGALAISQQLAKENSSDPWVVGDYARLLMAQQKLDEALEAIKPIHDAGKATAQTKMIEAMCLESKAAPDINGAIQAYKEAVKLDNSNWASANNLGLLLMEKDLWKEAKEAFTEANKREPNRAEPLLNLAICEAKAERKYESQQLAKEALTKAKGNQDLIAQCQRLIDAK